MRLDQIQQQIPNALNTGVNWAAVGAAVGTILGYLPGIAALFSIVWLGLQIWLFFYKKPWRRK